MPSSHLLSVASFILAFWALPLLCAEVNFEITLTWGIGAPDGQQRYLILTNGQYPGPQLNMDQGDDVEVGTSISEGILR